MSAPRAQSVSRSIVILQACLYLDSIHPPWKAPDTHKGGRMKSLKLALAVSALPLVAAAQDPVKVDPSHYKVLLDNPAVRVLKINVPAGAKTPMHSHPDGLLIPLTDG